MPCLGAEYGIMNTEKEETMPFEFSSTYYWLILAVVLAVVEINTSTLVCIWFVVGSAFAFATSFLTDSVAVQMMVFSLVSGICLAVTRPLAKKVVHCQLRRRLHGNVRHLTMRYIYLLDIIDQGMSKLENQLPPCRIVGNQHGLVPYRWPLNGLTW